MHAQDGDILITTCAFRGRTIRVVRLSVLDDIRPSAFELMVVGRRS